MHTKNITDQGDVSYLINKNIAVLKFQHPKSNALPGNILKKLADTITELGNNSEVKVIVLKSEGEKAFCAGASFDELLEIKNFDQGKEFFMGFARVINAARKCPKFIIGKIQGKAVGGGVGMAAAVDYCLATTAASVKLSELAIGIGPFVVGPAVERKIGKGPFSELAINATEWRNAAWAKEKGLYAEVFDSISELDKAAENLSEKLSQSSPVAMALLKKALWQGADDWDSLLEKRAEMSGKLVLSEFTRKAIESFKSA